MIARARLAGCVLLCAACAGSPRQRDGAAGAGDDDDDRPAAVSPPDADAPTPDAAKISAAPPDASAPDVAAPPDTSPGVDVAANMPVDAARDSARASGPPAVERWPGPSHVTVADKANQFATNLSGLTYEPAAGGQPAVLWASLNGPSTAYRLLWNGSTFAFDNANDWGAGKHLAFPGGKGDPDAESITRAEYDQPFIYVAIERDNDSGDTSRMAVLRFDASAAGKTLTAVNEWNLTRDLPAADPVDPNLGLEGLTWIPDAYLVANGFRDEARAAAYDPARYPDHGSGLFVVASEADGTLYAYALDHKGGTFTRVAAFASGLPAVMGLEFDRDSGALWAACDDTCAGALHVLGLSGGKWVLRRSFSRPSTLPDTNDEGIAFAPDSECQMGWKHFFWSDDDRASGHALRMDAIPCGPLF